MKDNNTEANGAEVAGKTGADEGAPKRAPEPPPGAEKQVAAAPAPADGPAIRAGGWMVPAYAGALLGVFLGERVVPTIDWARYALSGLGVLTLALVTALRFATAFRETGERRAVERTLAILSALGLIAVAAYFTTTDAGRALLGVSGAAPETRARIDAATTVGWVALLAIATVPLFFGEAALAPMRRAERIEVRRVRAATLSGVTLAFAAVYSALFVYGASQLDLKADFSYYRTARPGDSTKRVAESLTAPLKITAFFPQQNEVGAEVEGYLREVKAASPQITVEMQDRLLVPALAKEAKVTQDGVIVLSRDGSRETVTVGADMKTAGAKLKSIDADFQKALLKVIRTQRIAYMTVGHGEMNEAAGQAAAEGRTAKNLRKLLESQNYQVKDLGLAEGLASELPKDAYVVIVLGPQKEFLPEEVAALKRYADGGGHLLLALDPDAKVDLSPLAGAVGLAWKPEVLANDRIYVRRRYNESDHAMLVTQRYSSHASVSTLSRHAQQAPTIFAGAASLDKQGEGDLKIDFVVRSMGETFADANGNFKFDEGEKRSAYNLAAAVSKQIAPGGEDGSEKKELRAFVLADADAFSDAVFRNEPNIVLALDALRWLGGEESFAGEITTNEDVRIEHTKEKDQVWFWATILVAPALVLGLGLFITRRGRRASGRRA
ncbi:ABC transporter [Sorangium cellulosum]|uniref:ABC transporter n=1 Tax=Sorangium cellulosum TaxID=56 RepID=A0A2L0EXN6_SORCE|nr:Gldg family protein [Sorangium cellulosum]AUX44046.1 ABC transporter [Sorangium cellulosum]